MPYRTFNSQEEVAEYAAYLDAGWPMRTQIAEHIGDRMSGGISRGISDRISDHRQNCPQRNSDDALHIVELCCGPGKLAAALLPRFPTARYTGLDIAAPSLEFARKRLQAHASQATFIQTDLNQDHWIEQIDRPIHALVSMQSLHDLGGEPEVARIYGIAARLLPDDGIFINADLLASTVETPGSNPGRLTVPRHIELLQDAGFSSARCTLEIDGFACIVATR